MILHDDEHFMRQALREAQDAFFEGEVPIGAVVVINNQIISRGHNQVERLNDATAHAEVLAITSAFSHLGAKYLPDATLYVTIEPCHMCAGALYWSKLKRVVFGAPDVKQGFHFFYGEKNPFHPKTEITGGVLSEECAKLIKDFFKARR
ncbi:nucleoside deaminase [Segetibacter aerophilus]|uniref:tRNA-specific adenosine deaminase n=1 Tax=Segetibacter aerophilus TaxID=670293 RepID=A0A512BEX6_9BACT|nr:nucleoside deaminase [Segetibacter aerophilus]GEO10508.1 tRNA-specific adenosine deaminase [Segetibacter aerophilus]